MGNRLGAVSQNATFSSGGHSHFATLLSESGLSGTKLADRLDVTRQTVSRWRSGKGAVPKVVTLYLELLIATRSLSQ